jgi:hypothetical protein
MAAVSTRSPEGLIPGREAEVRRHDGGAALVAGGDDLKEQMGLVARERQVTDLVDDQDRIAADSVEKGGLRSRLRVDSLR